ncbi:MAG: cell division protein FtsZ [Lentimicrobium sp.]|nr:cell division protein FtsZ [Lentimicrobium sp.]
MLKFDLPKNQSSIIKVIGVGGGGSNAVTHMFNQGIRGVDFMICNTDAQALETSSVPLKIQLGTKGLGAGSIPQVGREAANENIDDIRKVLETNTKMVFITAGMGGGTGTGAAPVIAELARELGILTVGIVTIPFSFEGRKRSQQAQLGIEEMRKSVDTLLIICNDKLRELEGDLTITQAFNKADNILTVAAKGIAEIITVTGYINVDFEDVKTVMKDSGKAIMGSGIAEGENRALEAVQMAMTSPLLDDATIRGVSNILLYITSGSDEITLDEVMEITDYIQHEAGSSADIIWGNGTDESLGKKISITLVATGFDEKQKTGSQPRHEVIVHELNKPIPAVTSPHETEKPSPAPIEEITLITRKEEAPVKNEEILPPTPETMTQRTFTFEVGSQPSASAEKNTSETTNTFPATPLKSTSREPGFNFLKTFDDELNNPHDKQLQEEVSKSRDDKMREMSYKIATPEGLNEVENQPAYLRKNVTLREVPASDDSEVSRYTLSKPENSSVEIKPNNSFLHDNVD